LVKILITGTIFFTLPYTGEQVILANMFISRGQTQLLVYIYFTQRKKRCYMDNFVLTWNWLWELLAVRHLIYCCVFVTWTCDWWSQCL